MSDCSRPQWLCGVRREGKSRLQYGYCYLERQKSKCNFKKSVIQEIQWDCGAPQKIEDTILQRTALPGSDAVLR